MSSKIQNMDRYERLEQHWQILGLIHQMIRFSELKAGMVITLFSVILSLVFSAEELIRDKMDVSVLFLILMCIFGAMVTISFYYSVKAFFPTFFDKNPRSVIYYGDITNEYEGYKDYSTYLSSLCDEGHEMEIQIAEQIHTLSSIADSKFKSVKWAVTFLVVALITFFCAALLSFTI